MSARVILIVSLVSLLSSAAPGRAQRPSEKDVQSFVEKLRGRVSAATFENGNYRLAGITLSVPTDWTYGGTFPGANPGEDTAHWTDPKSGVSLFVWLNQRKADGQDVATLLDNSLANKAAQRERQGYKNWRLRTNSVQHTSVAGHQAVVAVADLGTPDLPRVERLVWVFTPETHVEFFATMNPDQLDTFAPEFDRVVQSVNLP